MTIIITVVMKTVTVIKMIMRVTMTNVVEDIEHGEYCSKSVGNKNKNYSM